MQSSINSLGLCKCGASGSTAQDAEKASKEAKNRVSQGPNHDFIMDGMTLTDVVGTSTHREFQLDNGLKTIVKEVHTAPLVSVWCWYAVGSRDELPGLTGVSHWVEHMNFKGTTNIPREQMKGIVERFGGMWNGYTWIDQTT